MTTINDLKEVSDVQVWKYDNGDFSANFAIDNKFMIQLGTDGEFSLPSSNEAAWDNDDDQDFAYSSFKVEDIVEKFSLPTSLEEIEEQFVPDYY